MNRLLALAALALMASGAQADEVKPEPGSVLVFGQALGGRLGHVVNRCPRDPAKPSKVCWLSSPATTPGGGKSGLGKLPEQYAPTWARYGLFEMFFERSGELASMSIRGVPSEVRSDMLQSISQRFGKPASNYVYDGGSRLTWVAEGVEVEVICVSECTANFNSSAFAQSIRKEVAERRQKEAARPKTP